LGTLTEAEVLEEGEGDQREQGVVVQPRPRAALEVVEAQLDLELQVRLLAGPAGFEGGDQRRQGRPGGVVGQVVLALAGTATPPARQLRVIAVAVASVVAALAILLTQAFRHLPLEQLHPLALAALGVCAGALLAAYAGIAAALLKEEPTREPATA
jgi:hypothetical protein